MHRQSVRTCDRPIESNSLNDPWVLVQVMVIAQELELIVLPREDEGLRELISRIGLIPILIPLKLFLATKFKFQNVMYIYWTDKHISLFFAVLRFVEQGHSETDIRYLIILKAEYGANFCDVILLGENVKIGKLK